MLLRGEIDLCLITAVLPLHERMNRWSLFVDAVVILVPEGPGDTEALTLETLQDKNLAWIKHGAPQRCSRPPRVRSRGPSTK